MKELKELVRPNIWALEPYSCARDEFKGMDAHVFLDANESPYNENFNRYPDPLCRDLCDAIGEYEGVDPSYVICGNGAADIIFRFAGAMKNKKALVTAPTFSEYETALTANGCTVERYLLKEENGFHVDASRITRQE